MPSLSPKRQAALAAEREKNAAGDRNFFRMKDHKVVMRLAPLTDDELIGTRIVSYFLNNRPFVCPELSFGTPGVIARTIRALRALGSPKAVEIAEGIDAQRRARFLMKVIVRGRDTLAVQWWEAPKSVYDEIFKVFDEDGEDLAHPKTGRDFRVSAEGTGMKKRYACRIMDPSLLAPTKEERLRLRDEATAMTVRDAIPLNEDRAVETLMDLIPEEIWSKIESQVLKGIDMKGAGKGKSSRRRDDDDDEDAKPSAGADEEDDEDEKPARKKAAKAADDEAASDDDEDDEKPARGKKKPAQEADDDDEDASEDDEDAAAASVEEVYDEDDV